MTPAPALSTRAFLWRAALACIPSASSHAQAALSGVHVEPNPQGGIYLVASNGETTLILADPEGVVAREATIFVSASFFEAHRREIRGPLSADDVFQINRGVASIIGGASAQEAKLVGLPFPDWKASLPDYACGWPPPISTEADETLSRIGRILSIAGESGVIRTGANNREVCVVRWPAWPRAVAFVEPYSERAMARWNKLDFLGFQAPLSMAAIQRRNFGLRGAPFEVVRNSPDDAA